MSTLQVMENPENSLLVKVMDVDSEHEFWIPKTKLVIEPASKAQRQRGWSAEKRQFFLEQYQWLKESGPQKEPFGREGKKRQAEWRERNGYSFVDPVQSNLSSWGAVLVSKGYVQQLPNGLWSTTDKQWED